MHIKSIRKGFGARLRALRKQVPFTQKELASKVDSSVSQLNKYECGFNIPSADRLIKLAEYLDTTVDYLLSGNQPEENTLHNTRLLKRFKELESFNSEDLDTTIKLLDALILKAKMSGVISMDKNV